MPRIPRLKVKYDDAIYHVILRITLPDYVLGDVEKDYFMNLMQWLSGIFFVEVFGFCVMGYHFYLLVKMKTAEGYSDEEVKERLGSILKKEPDDIMDGQLPFYRDKSSNLSEFLKELKQRFTRFYNKTHDKKGYFWGDRFKSVLVQDGDTLVNCLAYIDLIQFVQD